MRCVDNSFYNALYKQNIKNVWNLVLEKPKIRYIIPIDCVFLIDLEFVFDDP